MKFFSEETNVTESGIIYDSSFRRIETDLSKLLRRSNFKSRLITMDFFKLYNFFYFVAQESLCHLRRLSWCNGKTSFLLETKRDAFDLKAIQRNRAHAHRRYHLIDILPYYLPQIASRRRRRFFGR